MSIGLSQITPTAFQVCAVLKLFFEHLFAATVEGAAVVGAVMR
jgi:hypothetical protein